jgi:hypothetical protein
VKRQPLPAATAKIAEVIGLTVSRASESDPIGEEQLSVAA